MACPRCGCKETNHYDDEDAPDDNWERCAACGVIFDIEDHADEEDDECCGQHEERTKNETDLPKLDGAQPDWAPSHANFRVVWNVENCNASA